MTNLLQVLRDGLAQQKPRSAWGKGVLKYANELLADFDTPEATAKFNAISNTALLRKALLNGAADWLQYSEGGCSLIADQDIAERLCSPSELKRFKGGLLPASKPQFWIQKQAIALRQACALILEIARQQGLHVLATRKV